MPRAKRVIRPGDLVHVISRFVNREYRITQDEEREHYLDRLGGSIEKSDWLALSYAAMSSHAHVALVAGHEPFEQLIKRVHSPFAAWLNRRQGRLGPVFADRPRTIVVDPCLGAPLLAYLHNNPSRAGLAERTAAWTSHAAYQGLALAPEWLSVEQGLEIAGFDATPRGRAAFAEYVAARAAMPRDPMLVGDLRKARREARAARGAEVAIRHPTRRGSALDYAPRSEVTRWEGPVGALLGYAAEATGVAALVITSPSRQRSVVAARRLFALLAASLGRPHTEIGLHLGISEAAIRKLLSRASDQERATAQRLVAQLHAELKAA